MVPSPSAMRLIVADDDASLRKQLKRFFESRGHAVVVARDGVEAWLELRRKEPDVVLCDVGMPHMDGAELTRTIRRNPATRHVPVVLFSATPNHPRLAELDLPDEVIPKPLDLDLLEERLRALLRRIDDQGPQPAQRAGGRLVAVTSAKGGSGVSSIAANLALAAATAPTLSVVAVDLDLEYGDIPMLVDVPPRAGVDDLIRALALDADDVAPEDHFARHASGLRILGAPRSPVDALRVDEGGVNHMLSRLRALHDLIVADVPPGFGDPALATLTTADRIVVVIVPEVTALRRTLTLFDILHSLGVEDERLLLVYNETVASQELPRERVEQFLRRRIPLAVPHDLALFHRATTSGRPVVVLEPQHAVGQAFQRLLQFVLTPV